MPKLTIITINYNNLEGLKRTVESVVNQTWQEFEYIVIDGGSTDGSAAYIESQNKHFDYWVSEPDKGIYNAMNKGIAKATGEYLLFLNSGDELNDLESLQKNHVYLEEKELVYFNINVIGENVSFVKKCPQVMTFSFLYNNTLPHQSTFIRKSLFERIGYYDENIKIVADWKFFIVALCKYNATYKYIDSVFSIFYLDGISSSSDKMKELNKEREDVLEAEFSIFLNEAKEYFEMKKVVINLRSSRKLKLLVKLGFLNKF
jgi:glycosyltransferase involved in cell wall biosynthesis